MFVGLLVEGAILAVPLILIAFLLSRFIRDIIGRSLLVIFLFAAAGAYFGFALLAAPGPIWVLAELVQVIIFGAIALLGLRGSPWWLAAGWALHPLWDVVLHYVGPGHSFAPITYTIPCLSFDLLVAAYTAIAYGLVGDRRLRFRHGAT
ncbi:MAG TPA: DUF6010 family protein [Rubrobacteraceae bacterium]|jgi:hypothetical protein